ncbi:CBS domain-containing protein [Halotalea alkalilenta]|uniref:CBS domain-containing protein n=1 Tax=Halotalea alkalilenta TaxID=376489 RepID=UPI0004869E27|nr:CBS domain-containing protein [Halotalea alkalilenta]
MVVPPTDYSTLPLVGLKEVSHLSRPPQLGSELELDMHSPATSLMTDFAQTRAQTIYSGSRAKLALTTMKNSDVHMLVVLNDNGVFVGILTARILVGGRWLTVAAQSYGVPYSDVTVEMIMIKRDELRAIPYRRLRQANLGDVVQTLRDSGERHILILDDESADAPAIRGVISARDVSAALGVDLEHPPEAHSFSAIRSVVLGHDL